MTLATGTFDRHGETGFTLVELVVVMLIVGIASAAAVLALPGAGDDVRHSAERLAAHTVAARDMAILSGQSVRLEVRSDGLTPQVARSGGWQAQPDLPRLSLPAGQSLASEPAGAIAFDATGLATPARLVIRQGEAAAAVTIDAAGGVHAGPA